MGLTCFSPADKCEIENGGCGSALCDTDDVSGDVMCSCREGETLLNSGDRCAQQCFIGYLLNMETGDCDGRWCIYMLYCNGSENTEGIKIWQ